MANALQIPFIRNLANESNSEQMTGATNDSFILPVPPGALWSVDKIVISAEGPTAPAADNYFGETGVGVSVFFTDLKTSQIGSGYTFANMAELAQVATIRSGVAGGLVAGMHEATIDFGGVVLSGGQGIFANLTGDFSNLTAHSMRVQGFESANAVGAFSRAYISALDFSPLEDITSGVTEVDFSILANPISGTISGVFLMRANGAEEIELVASNYFGTSIYEIPNQFLTGSGLTRFYAQVRFADGTIQNGQTIEMTITPQAATFGGVTPTTAVEAVSETWVADVVADGDSVINSVTYDWGDGEADTVDNAAPYSQAHTYAEAGTYTLTLTILFSDGTTQVETETITITAA